MFLYVKHNNHFPELHGNLLNCLLKSTIWISQTHLKVNPFHSPPHTHSPIMSYSLGSTIYQLPTWKLWSLSKLGSSTCFVHFNILTSLKFMSFSSSQSSYLHEASTTSISVINSLNTHLSSKFFTLFCSKRTHNLQYTFLVFHGLADFSWYLVFSWLNTSHPLRSHTPAILKFTELTTLLHGCASVDNHHFWLTLNVFKPQFNVVYSRKPYDLLPWKPTLF